jgi:DNA modification methylase
MAKLRLTEEEKLALIDALNNDTEPSPDLVPKLFPSTAEKFDYVSLDRAKVPTLEYAGKRSRAAILAEASAGIGAAPLQVARCFGEAKDDEWKNMLVQGDNLQFLKTCYRNEDPLIKDKVKGKVKLIYIDPPFATKSDFGGKEGEKSYTDKILAAEFVDAIRERMIYFRELLADDGSIYIHLDWKMASYIRVAMDEVFGKDNLRREIIWSKGNLFGYAAAADNFVHTHDTILYYTKKVDGYFFNKMYQPYSEEYINKRFTQKDEKGRYRLQGKNQKQYLDDSKGVPVKDVWDDISIVNVMAVEKTDYQTQKPEQLLERVVLASSEPGDLVIDLFAGSGTTSAVAEKLGRRWIACDFGKHAIYTMQRRMMRIDESKALGEVKDENDKVITKKGDAYGKKANPFCVLSSGAYDFSHVMELREHKNNYVNFVLGLFQLSHDEKIGQKFKSDIVFAERNGNPVEVYPVWHDEFLKEVRIDESYLESILTQSGGKLKGEYYIITPETCTNIGDTTLKNDNGEDVTFKMLTFPYKVLEDVSRKLTLQDQPSKPEDVNQLISSTAFYFNEDVEIEVTQTDKGLQINHFETKILDGQGNRFDGYTGLAMLLVDDDYEEGKPFDMDKTIFLKDVKDDGSVVLPDLGKSVGVIAIDKHGNESKPAKVK